MLLFQCLTSCLLCAELMHQAEIEALHICCRRIQSAAETEEGKHKDYSALLPWWIGHGPDTVLTEFRESELAT